MPAGLVLQLLDLLLEVLLIQHHLLHHLVVLLLALQPHYLLDLQLG